MGQTQTQFKVGDTVRAKFTVSGYTAQFIRMGMVTKVLPPRSNGEVLEVRLDDPIDKDTKFAITYVYAWADECEAAQT